MIDPILNSIQYLLRLCKANERQYNVLITQAGPDELRSVLVCVRMCADTKIIRDRKSLRSVIRNISLKRAVQVFRKNRKTVKAVIVYVLLRLVGLTISHVVCSCE